MDPLPDLGAGDLSGGGVLHQVVDGRGAIASQPGLDVLDAHADVEAQSGLCDGTVRHRHVDQLRRADRYFVAPAPDLVGPLTENLVEGVCCDLDEVGMSHPGPVEAVA